MPSARRARGWSVAIASATGSVGIRAARARLEQERRSGCCPRTGGAHEMGWIGFCTRCGGAHPERPLGIWTDAILPAPQVRP
ncbi:MAG: hypothetical protein ACREFK_01570 [Stellaceae bacterium]